MKDIKLNDILVCEDIRTEVGGQHTIVGLTSQLNATVPKEVKSKINVPLSFMFRFSNLKKDLNIKQFTVVIIGEGKELVKRVIPIQEGKEIQEHFNIALMKENIIIEDSAIIGFKFYIEDRKGKIHEIKTNYEFKINLNRK